MVFIVEMQEVMANCAVFCTSLKEASQLKYWRGYLVAAIILLCNWALGQFCAAHTELVDMVYPYVDRIVMDYLAGWSAQFDGCLWQTILVFVMVLVVASVALMVILRWNPIQVIGWILAALSLFPLLNTGMYGINQYTGPIAEDIRLEVTEYSVASLEDAAIFYRDMANEYSAKVSRNADGTLRATKFDQLTVQAADGFQVLSYDRVFPIFTGSTVPVKELGWEDRYDGVTGITVGVTGESAVNPNVPAVGMPFAICHEMSHRMCIYHDSDANFAAFLACTHNSSEEFIYSGYLMAFRACYNGLSAIQSDMGSDALDRVMAGVDPQVMEDLEDYNSFLGEDATKLDSDFCTLLVSWHIQEVTRYQESLEEQIEFDPMDETNEQLQSVINPYPSEDSE